MFFNMAIEQSIGAIRDLGRSLIDTFGQGWSRGNVDLLMSVYGPEVVFIETPFSEPLAGHRRRPSLLG